MSRGEDFGPNFTKSKLILYIHLDFPREKYFPLGQAMSETTTNSGNLVTALVSGATAASVTGLLTFPFDSIKTQQQLNNTAYASKWKIPGNYPSSIAQIYKGASALVVGGIFKSSTRLISFNWATKFMSLESHDLHGHPVLKSSAPRIVIAGAIAGFMETIWLIPFENIKITMIQNMSLQNELTRCADANIRFNITGIVDSHHKPAQNIFTKQYISPHAYYTSKVLEQYKLGRSSSRFTSSNHFDSTDVLKRKLNKAPTQSMFGTISDIYKLRGISGFTQGTFITYIRQSATSIVWFWTYNATRQLIDPKKKESVDQQWFSNQHSMVTLLGLHLLSTLAVIAATQPIDVVKSHLQSKNGKLIYQDSLSTAYRLFSQQGFKSLFRGALPRGLKVLVSGGLTATVYSYVEDIVNLAGTQNPFLS